MSLGFWGTPWRSLGSCRVAGFIGVRTGVRLALQVSLGSFGIALGVVGCVLVRWVH